MKKALPAGLIALLAPAVARACPACASLKSNGSYLAATAILFFVPLVMTAVFVAWIRACSARAEREGALREGTPRVQAAVKGAALQAVLLFLFLVQPC